MYNLTFDVIWARDLAEAGPCAAMLVPLPSRRCHSNFASLERLARECKKIIFRYSYACMWCDVASIKLGCFFSSLYCKVNFGREVTTTQKKLVEWGTDEKKNERRRFGLIWHRNCKLLNIFLLLYIFLLSSATVQLRWASSERRQLLWQKDKRRKKLVAQLSMERMGCYFGLATAPHHTAIVKEIPQQQNECRMCFLVSFWITFWQSRLLLAMSQYSFCNSTKSGER